MLLRMKIGSVVCAPAVNVVTITSSNESAKASRPPAIRAVESTGHTTKRNVCQPSAPRAIDASTIDGGVRRSRADTLFETTTTQKVAWAITIVQIENLTPAHV